LVASRPGRHERLAVLQLRCRADGNGHSRTIRECAIRQVNALNQAPFYFQK